MRQTEVKFNLRPYGDLFFITLPAAMRNGALNLADKLDQSAGGKASAIMLPLSKILKPGLKTFATLVDHERDGWREDHWFYNPSKLIGLVGFLTGGIVGGMYLAELANLSIATFSACAVAGLIATPPLFSVAWAGVSAIAGLASSATWGLFNGIINIPNGIMNTVDAVRGVTPVAPAASAPVVATPQPSNLPDENPAPLVMTTEMILEKISTSAPAEQEAFFKSLRSAFPDRVGPPPPKVISGTAPVLKVDRAPV